MQIIEQKTIEKTSDRSKNEALLSQSSGRCPLLLVKRGICAVNVC